MQLFFSHSDLYGDESTLPSQGVENFSCKFSFFFIFQSVI